MRKYFLCHLAWLGTKAPGCGGKSTAGESIFGSTLTPFDSSSCLLQTPQSWRLVCLPQQTPASKISVLFLAGCSYTPENGKDKKNYDITVTAPFHSAILVGFRERLVFLESCIYFMMVIALHTHRVPNTQNGDDSSGGWTQEAIIYVSMKSEV